MKVACVSLKGGTGKSTVALHLASYFASEQGLRTAIRDTDGQGSLYDLFHVYANGMGGAVASGLLELESPGSEYDVLIADMPPYVTEDAGKNLAQYDVIIIPCKYSSLELFSLMKFIPLVEKAKEINPSLKAGILFNQVKPGTAMLNQIEDAISDLKYPISKKNVPVFVTKIHDRVDFARSMVLGGIFNENENNTAALNMAARGEIKNLAQEVFNMYNQ